MFCPMQGMAAMFKKSSAKVQNRKNKQHICIYIYMYMEGAGGGQRGGDEESKNWQLSCF